MIHSLEIKYNTVVHRHHCGHDRSNRFQRNLPWSSAVGDHEGGADVPSLCPRRGRMADSHRVQPICQWFHVASVDGTVVCEGDVAHGPPRARSDAAVRPSCSGRSRRNRRRQLQCPSEARRRPYRSFSHRPGQAWNKISCCHVDRWHTAWGGRLQSQCQ